MKKLETVAVMCTGHADEPPCVMLPEDMRREDATCALQPLVRRADVVAYLRTRAAEYRRALEDHEPGNDDPDDVAAIVCDGLADAIEGGGDEK